MLNTNILFRYLVKIFLCLNLLINVSQAETQTDFFDGSFSNTFTVASDYVFRSESETNDGDIVAAQLSSVFTKNKIAMRVCLYQPINLTQYQK